jgi:hypothetical protein
MNEQENLTKRILRSILWYDKDSLQEDPIVCLRDELLCIDSYLNDSIPNKVNDEVSERVTSSLRSMVDCTNNASDGYEFT